MYEKKIHNESLFFFFIQPFLLRIFPIHQHNLVVGNSYQSILLLHDHLIQQIDEGLSIITDKDLNDKNDKKINFYYKLFLSLQTPNPSLNNWDIWKENLTNFHSDQLKNNQKICFINHQFNYGTRSSSLIAIPNITKSNNKIVFQSTSSFPTKNNYVNVII